MSASRFADRLAGEFAARRAKNRRYSLRAFAAWLGTDHSTLSQILRGRRRTPARQVRAWAKKLGMEAEEAAVWIALEHASSEADRHWTAEALAVTETVHWRILDLSRAPEFRADSRWLAQRTGVTADVVNIALSRLLRLGLIEMRAGRWTEQTGLDEWTEPEFRKLALQRVKLCQIR
jgi:transcriptional regulator with XRE-family HTH domain